MKITTRNKSFLKALKEIAPNAKKLESASENEKA